MAGETAVDCDLCGVAVPVSRATWSEGRRICPECFEALRGARREAMAATSGEPSWAGAAGLGVLLGIVGGAAAFAIATWYRGMTGFSVVLPSVGVGAGVLFGSGRKRGPKLQALSVGLALVLYAATQYAIYGYLPAPRDEGSRLSLPPLGRVIHDYVDVFSMMDVVALLLSLWVAWTIPRERRVWRRA